jgi:DegV family protein with EDD domain
MQQYQIATSSTSDLTREWLEEHGIPFIAYSYTVGAESFQDDCREESRARVYAGMRQGDLLKTSMISEYSYQEFFRGLLAKGQDVIFLDMSQKMSVSYENSRRAAEKIRAEFPDRQLYVMDTRCISGGLGYLVQRMVERQQAGASWDEVIAWGEENKLKIAHRFTVNDLKYLKAGGRVSNVAALVGTILSIKPVLYVPDAGTLDVLEKVRGRKSALHSILNGVLRDLEGTRADGVPVTILHADCREDAEWLRDQLRSAHPELGEITISGLGVVIGAHCGPGLLTVFYLCGGRNK